MFFIGMLLAFFLQVYQINALKAREEKIKTEIVANFANSLEHDVFEPSKPNLPIIEGDNIAFKNTDNEVIKIKDDRYGYISSLYKAILKHSTNEQPNIVDTEKFYMDVEKNFSKKAFSDSPAINSALESGYIAISNMFDRLYRVVTDDRSQEGKTITVEESRAADVYYIGIRRDKKRGINNSVFDFLE